jgi:hypothetical protein
MKSRERVLLGLSHASHVGSPLENILAIYEEAGSLMRDIDPPVLSIGGNTDDVNKINLAKLF